ALSAKEAARIRAFLAGSGGAPGGTVLCDGTPGLFDEHGKLLPRSPLEDLFPAAAPWERSYAARADSPRAAERDGDLASAALERLAAHPAAGWLEWIETSLGDLPRAAAAARPREARALIHRFRLGQATLLGVERNIDYRMSEELKQAGGNRSLEEPIEVELRLGRAAHVYDLRAGTRLARTAAFSFTL